MQALHCPRTVCACVYLSALDDELLLCVCTDGRSEGSGEHCHHDDTAKHPDETEQACRDGLGRPVTVPAVTVNAADATEYPYMSNT